MDTNVYSIVDLDNYAALIRDSAAHSLAEEYEDDLNEYISVDQTKEIIIGYSLGQDDDGAYLINEEVFNDTFDDIKQWILEVGLAKLASRDLIECAWDNESNNMVFWAKNNDQQANTATKNRNR